VALGFAAIGLSEANVITVFILGVLFVSVCTGSRIYGAAASFFSVLLFNFFFTVPRFTLQFNDPGYAVTFAIMFAASFITSTLTVRAQRQARQSSLKAYRTEVLLETSQKLQQSETQDDIIRQMARQMQRLLGRTICLYLADGKTLGRPTVFPTPDAGTDTAPYITPGEQAVAEWVFRNNKHAGAGTDTLPGAKCLYLAVRSQDTVFAVAGIAMDLGGPLDVYDRNLLLAMLNSPAVSASCFPSRVPRSRKRTVC
jgi:two-component system sensor histidine kinase KdpD